MQIQFEVAGKPFGKQRPRFQRAGSFVKTYTPQETVNYENLVKYNCQEAMAELNWDGWFNDEPLEVFILSCYEIPKSYSNKRREDALKKRLFPTKKPDIDNVAKIILDSLSSVLFHDDTQVISIHVDKIYTKSPTTKVIVRDKPIRRKGEEEK